MKNLILISLFCFISLQFTEAAFRNYFYNFYDEMANSACVGLSVGHNVRGHMAAVRRNCAAKTTCNELCSGASKPSFVTEASWKCFDSLHVYKPEKDLGDNYEEAKGFGEVGPYFYRYNACDQTNCGPNYCCCHAT